MMQCQHSTVDSSATQFYWPSLCCATIRLWNTYIHRWRKVVYILVSWPTLAEPWTISIPRCYDPLHRYWSLWIMCGLQEISGDLSHLPGDDDQLRLPIEINKGLFIDDEQPIVIAIGWLRTTFRIARQKVDVKYLHWEEKLEYRRLKTCKQTNKHGYHS